VRRFEHEAQAASALNHPNILTVYEFGQVTGSPAFQGDTASDVIAEILKGEPEPLAAAVPGISPQFEAIVLRALRKSPKERYQSASEILGELQEFHKESEFQEKLQRSGGQMGTMVKLGSPPELRALPAGKSSISLVEGLSATHSARRKVLKPLLAAALTLLLIAFVATPLLRKRWSKHPAIAAPRELAVLPFRNLRPDPQSDFLGFSLADAIITKLGYVSALSVRPSSSVESIVTRWSICRKPRPSCMSGRC
jgi:serine/threonine protein kinase